MREHGIAAVEPGQMLAFFTLQKINPQRVDLAELHGQQAEVLNPIQVRQLAAAPINRVDEPPKLNPVHGQSGYTWVFLETNSTP